MKQTKECRVCGCKFDSEKGVVTCSTECATALKRKSWSEANKRRMLRKHGITPMKICPVCNQEFETSRNTYCSETCAKVAKEQYSEKYWGQYYKENRCKIIDRVIGNRK